MAVASVSLRPNLIIAVVFFAVVVPRSDSLPEAEALRNFKKSLDNTEALGNWIPNSFPCNDSEPWDGVLCYRSVITGLRLEDMGLSGRIDIDALLQLKDLRYISFERNSFSGSFPEFNRIGFLKSLSMSGNRFSGEIPVDYFKKMGNLKKLWLNDNNFTGPIPSSLTLLSAPIELHLENNHFSGNIPNIDKPTLVIFNVSNNKLEGGIPSGLSKFDKSSFAGNSGLCGEKLGKSCDMIIEQPKPIDTQHENIGPNHENNNGKEIHSNSDQFSVWKIAVIVAAGVVIVLLLVFAVVRSRRKEDNFATLPKENKEEKYEEAVEVQVAPAPIKKEAAPSTRKLGSSRKGSSRGGGFGDLVMVNTEKGVFGLPDLMKASAEVLGNGGLGSSYKAVMANGVAVVVKRMRELKALGRDGFDAEMTKLGRLKHWNILTPLAYHYRNEENLVVFEYVPKGSLLYLLHGDRGPSHSELDWPARLKIVQGIAEGLNYLHKELFSDLPHGNLKSSNILLGPSYEPLLMDYGYNSMASPSIATQALFGYKAPEAIQCGQVSPKCDVYCLGIIILEILTGKFPSQYMGNGQGGFDVVQWIGTAISEGRESELLDPEIGGSKSSISEMVRLLHVGAACTESNPEKRLDMMEAIRRIKSIKVMGGQQVLPSSLDSNVNSISIQDR
ncbi:pollen receptor-like kinase 3 [Senna tora]|uniref:Pollen receptor-like kinase 3 n=1 Tax=Senna tora TaxID=362788 RepID=A0A834T568_9FABA|nr:pollen receptor-like kinase 3 [Senna tora]